MDEIITNEFIAYKSGFIDGKCEILTQIVENEGMNLFVKETFGADEESWYSYGYDDGYNHYLSEFLTTKKNPIGESRKNETEALKDCFAKRVIEINKSENKEVPIAKFRI